MHTTCRRSQAQTKKPAVKRTSDQHASRFGGTSRRDFLKFAAAACAGGAITLPASTLRAQQREGPPRVAAIFTSFTYRSHAHVILENFLLPYLFNGQRTEPGVEVVSFYADQLPDGDMSRDIARQFDIPMYGTIAEALTLGGDKLAVDAVLSIGEHGDYPVNDLGQREYPRKRFFDEIVAVMRESGRFVPLFNDKHLSYRWDWSKEMYDQTQQLGIPFMAGSSVPLAERRPPLELPPEAKITDAVSIHGGPLESYDFHGLEVLQSMVEDRQGGESGVSEIEFLAGDALMKAADEGRWSIELAKAAMAAELGSPPDSLWQVPGESRVEPHGILITYKDGFKATMLKVGASGIRWNFACRIQGEDAPRATHFHVGPWDNRNLFKALSHAIQHHFTGGRAPYPAERTLLTTGALEAAMRARVREGGKLETPHLEIAYRPRDFRAMREMGATWDIITDEVPQPRGIEPVGLEL
ncbi:MAG: twin-arginine translocation signal domain-containing protein [Pirellulales bacterium]